MEFCIGALGWKMFTKHLEFHTRFVRSDIGFSFKFIIPNPFRHLETFRNHTGSDRLAANGLLAYNLCQLEPFKNNFNQSRQNRQLAVYPFRANFQSRAGRVTQRMPSTASQSWKWQPRFIREAHDRPERSLVPVAGLANLFFSAITPVEIFFSGSTVVIAQNPPQTASESV